MSLIFVWMLVVVSESSYNRGNATVVGHFTNQIECDLVKNAIPLMDKGVKGRCIATKMLLPTIVN